MPHEFVMTLPGAYHQVVNTGRNCAEACNFSTPQWLDSAMRFKKCAFVRKKDATRPEGERTPNIPVPFMVWPHLRTVTGFKKYLSGNIFLPDRSNLNPTRVPAPTMSALFSSVLAWKAMPHPKWIHDFDEGVDDRNSELAYKALADRCKEVAKFQVS
jgi:hypothetical protein